MNYIQVKENFKKMGHANANKKHYTHIYIMTRRSQICIRFLVCIFLRFTAETIA